MRASKTNPRDAQYDRIQRCKRDQGNESDLGRGECGNRLCWQGFVQHHSDDQLSLRLIIREGEALAIT